MFEWSVNVGESFRPTRHVTKTAEERGRNISCPNWLAPSLRFVYVQTGRFSNFKNSFGGYYCIREYKRKSINRNYSLDQFQADFVSFNVLSTARIVCGAGPLKRYGVLPSVLPVSHSLVATACGGFAADSPEGKRH